MNPFLSGCYYSFLSLVFFCSTSGRSYAQQQEKPGVIVGSAWQQGHILVHSSKIRHFASTQPIGFELNVQKRTSGKQPWHGLYQYPRVGLSFIYLDYKQIVIGKSLSLSSYLSLPVKTDENSSLFFRFGTGLSYFTNKFNIQENPTNNIISARFNAVIQTRLEYERKVSSKTGLLLGLGLNHYSNGGNAKPNLGVNIVTGTMGINYHSNSSYKPLPANSTAAKNSPFYISISSSIGVKQRNDFDPVKYLVTSAALSGYYPLNQKSTLLIALEGFYDPSLFPRRRFDPRVKPGTTPDIRRSGLTVGHELAFGKVSFGTQVGYYVYRPYKSDAAFYQRLETKVKLHQHLFIAAGLKLHDIIKADIIEYRLGLQI